MPGLGRLRAVKRGFVFNFFICFAAPSSREREGEEKKGTRLRLRKCWREGGKKTRETEQERKVDGQIPKGGRDRDSVRGRDGDAKGILRVSTLDDGDEVELHVLGCRLT